ncbi:RNA polymerase sigma factor [Pedobacter sp. AW31-3R]|uniref:RNA polymerase sigma factor n=1 Tax=Pedobacter sp. AW31-3R TaxID=3445781 RepID=UPI003FA0FBF7
MPKQVTAQERSDEELLIAMKSGDRSAFVAIYERYWRKLHAESFKRLKNMQQIEELVQDIFSDLWLKRDSKEILNLRNYLMMCTRYQVFAIYRKEKSNPDFEEPMENMAFYSVNADSRLNEKDMKSCIDIWLKQQPTKRGEIFRLKYREDMSTKEIGEVLNISQKTVQNQLVTSYNSLREFMKKMTTILSSAAW